MDEALEALRAGWFSDLPAAAVQPLGDGHINDTYLVMPAEVAAGVSSAGFVLQRLSSQVFEDPARVMGNTVRVLDHLAGTDLQLPELVPSMTDQAMWISSGDAIWRLWRYREDTRTLKSPIKPAEAEQAGWAFGRFQQLLADLPDPPLPPVIPGFLDLRHYLSAYDHALAESAEERASAQSRFIAAERARYADVLLPRRDYIHGDCKVDNLLFCVTNADVDSVLDLDTVMLGHWAWDFGDLARSLATSAGKLDLALVAAAARGFCRGRGIGSLPAAQPESAETLEALLIAPGYVSFMLAVRFVTDHLAGDRYFKVRYRGENLERADLQIALCQSFAQHRQEMRRLLTAELLR